MGGPRYPKQQLRSVSLETFFPGRFSALAGLDRVQDRIRGDLPNLFVPNVEAGQAIAIRPYQFRDDRQIESLAIAINQATYISFHYPGYEAFAPRALGVLGVFYEECGIESLDRVVYRYENEISFARDRNRIPLDRILKLPLPGWCRWEDGLRDVSLGWTRDTGRGAFTFSLAVGPSDALRGEVLKITISSMVRPAGDVDRLADFANATHEEAASCFDEMITDDFRTVLSGQEEEE